MKDFLKKLKNKIKTRLKTTFFYKQEIVDSKLQSKHFDDGTIHINWNLAKDDIRKLNNKRIHCLGLRIFDITHNLSNNHKTTIMKEIQLNKQSFSYNYRAPLPTGLFSLEIGYRDQKSKWVKLCSSFINLGIRASDNKFVDDSWFYLSDNSNSKMPASLHEKLYQLSQRSSIIGGSERIYPVRK